MRRISLMLAVTLMTPGCAHYHIMVPAPERGTQPMEAPSRSGGWGAVREDVIAKNCVSNAMAEVRVKRDFGQGLLAWLTLGAYQPATIEWYCAKPPAPDGTVDLGNSN